MKNLLHLIFIAGIMVLFFVFLFQGICDEQDRRDGQKSHRPWLYERFIAENER